MTDHDAGSRELAWDRHGFDQIQEYALIYTDQFVWLHFPKCAGTTIEHLFKKYFSERSEVTQDPVGLDLDPTIAWHDSVRKRETRDPGFRLGDRVVICSIRRLPSWLMSRYSFEVKRNPKLPHDPERLLVGKFLEANGYENNADYYIGNYLPDALLDSCTVRFLRTEHFEEDYKAVFGEFLDLSVIPEKEYRQALNTSKSSVPDEIRQRLVDDAASLYEHCPKWKRVEAMAYGSL